MNVEDLRSRLRARAELSEPPQVDTAGIVRAVRRRRQRQGLAGLTAVLVAAAATVALTSGSSRNSGDQVLVPARPGPTGAAPTGAPRPTALPSEAKTLPALSSRWQPQAPAGQFIGFVGAGVERAAVIDNSTGRIERYLQETGNQSLLVRYGTTLVQGGFLQGECRYNYQVVSVNPPSTVRIGAPQDIGRLVPGSTPQRYAYQQNRPGGTYYGAQGRKLITGCGGSPLDLVLQDRATGQTRTWSAYDRGKFLVDSYRSALDPTGQHLAVSLNGQLRILDVNGNSTRLGEGRLIPTPSNGTLATPCVLTELQFQPATHIVWVGQQCYVGAFLASYDIDSGKLLERRQIAEAGSNININSFDVDPAGNIIGTLGSSDWPYPTDGRVFISRPRQDPQIIPGYGVYQALW